MSAGPSDPDLVLLLRRRHPGAFEEVFRRYQERIWRFLCRLASDRALAEDLFQDTWLAAARNAHRLREDTQLGPWLYTIARNKQRNTLRFAAYEQRKVAWWADRAPAGAPAPDDQAEALRVATRLADGFARLTIAHREVLTLAVHEGLPTPSIAAVLGLREETVRKRLSRARAELARESGIESTP